MEPHLKKATYAFVELNSLLNNKEVGLFSMNNEILIRRFYDRKGKITLKADNKEIPDINITDSDNFFIIGKILNIK